MKLIFTGVLMLIYVSANCQIASILTVEKDAFLLENDSLINEVDAIDKYDSINCELKAFIFHLRYDLEGNQRKSLDVLYFSKDSLSWVFHKDPFEEVLDFKNDELKSYINDRKDRKELEDLKTLKGFYRQGESWGDRILYLKNNVSLVLFYDRQEPLFGYVKFGAVNPSLGDTNLDRKQQKILYDFIDGYF